MAQYIDKDRIVEEIEKRMQELRPTNTHKMQVGEKMDRDVLMWLNALTWVKKSINTLEVEEVDLEKHLKEDIEDAVHGTVDYPLIGCDFPNIFPNYKELKEYCDRNGIKDNDKVKLIIIKDV